MTSPTQTDPGPAAHSAKNKPTGPGLPNQSDSYSERNPMVGTTAEIVRELRVTLAGEH